jgi:hypothetical protein
MLLHMTNTNPPVKLAGRFTSSGHWYDRNGNQLETVAGSKKNSQVKPDLRHARKLDLAPGITTILREAPRAGLEKWKVSQAIQAALTLPQVAGETSDEWIDRILADSEESAAAAADRGTELHARVERDLGAHNLTDPWAAAVAGQLGILTDGEPRQWWASEVGCASRLGFGTKVDLALISSDGSIPSGFVVDMKSKDGVLDRETNRRPLPAEIRTYDDHAMQLVAGATALTGLDWATLSGSVRGAIVFVNRDEPEARLVEIPQKDLDAAWDNFRSLLFRWQVRTGYRPSWAHQVAAFL